MPICPELFDILIDAFESSPPGQEMVIQPGRINAKNVSRDFGMLCRRTGVKRWAKPLHTLRKTCITRWAREHPQHVVQAWAGHADSQTTSQYYLQVSEEEYRKASRVPAMQDSEGNSEIVARLVARLPDFGHFQAQKEKGTDSQVHALKAVHGKAGEEIRTPDVQLGKLKLSSQHLILACVITSFMGLFYGYNWLTSH